MEQIVFREDSLSSLNAATTYQQKLAIVHNALRKRCPGVDRVSVALYDNQTHSLKTFIASPSAESPLQHYEVTLAEESSLLQLAKSSSVRVVNDLSVYKDHDTVHSRSIVGHGFASSCTYPLNDNDNLSGFIFFNSFHNRYFRERVLEQVEVFVHLLNEMIVNDLDATHALVAAMQTSVSMVQKHDMETGSHLERISRYTRLIARYLAKKGAERLDEEQVEQMALFSSLHDIGKIGIPDRILQKSARLNLEEREIMNSHTRMGRLIVDDMISNFGFEQVPYIDCLRNITELHHEAMDGSGYPHGLHGEEIALEARIVAVSDIFDALTSRRPYKEAWSNGHAFALLQLMTIDKLDKWCVNALVESPDEVVRIQGQFAEEGDSLALS